MKLELESVPICPVCQGKNFGVEVKCVDELVSKAHFSIVECANCGLRLTSPRPSRNTIGQFYKSDQYVSHSDSKRGFIHWIYHIVRSIALRQKLSYIRHFSNGARLLDFGAGSGGFVSFMTDNGYDCVGVEPDADARSVASLKYNIELQDPSILDDTRGLQAFDVVTMWHVLEHTHDPLDLLARLRAIINNDGLLVVAVPNYKSKDAQTYKSNWAAYDVPRHLFHFSTDSLTKAATLSGFSIDKIIPMRFDAYYVSMLSEKNIGGNILKGIINGFLSNANARFGNSEYSSLIYILRPLKPYKAT